MVSSAPTWSKVACITDDPILGASISSHFNSPNEYFAIMSGPRMQFPDWENEVIRKANTCALLRAEIVVLAGLPSAAVESFTKRLSGTQVLLVNSLAAWDESFSRVGSPRFVGTTRCSPDEVMWGLLLAKRRKHRLEMVAGSPSIRKEADYRPGTTDHCVMVDDMRDVVPIIGANYAFAINSNLRVLPPIDFDEIDNLYDTIQESGNRKDPNRRARAKSQTAERSKRFTSTIDTQGLNFITFITRGVPYGYFVNEVPTTHLYSYLDLGRYVADSIYYAIAVTDTRLALVVDPGFFVDSESDEVIMSLRARGIKVKEIRGNDATRRNVQHYICYYPYDLAYICTHAGELREGRRLTIQFRTRDGKDHILIADVAHTFVPGEPIVGRQPMVEVMRFARFVELDGVLWTDDEKKKLIGAGDIIREFSEISEDAWNVLQWQDADTIRDFPIIQATDGPIALVSEYFAGGGLARPIVFNNACNSLHKLSTWLIIAGARGYIGTIVSVEDDLAKRVGREFFSRLTDEMPLPMLLWQVQRDILPRPAERVYLHFGCHFNTVRGPRQNATTYPKAALAREIEAWQAYLAGNHPEKFKKTVRQILVFVERALREEG